MGLFAFLESGGVDEPAGFDKIAGSDFGQRSWPGARVACAGRGSGMSRAYPTLSARKAVVAIRFTIGA